MHKRKKHIRLGAVVATPGAISAINKAKQSPAEFLRRHQRCDWGDICPEDKLINNQAVAHEGDLTKQQRVLSSYRTCLNEVIWVVTEFDRSISTILLPSDY